MEGDASPPLGARRRFSALMDTHRFASPLEGESEFLSRQNYMKVRGTSLDGTSVPSPSLLEQRSSLKEINGAGVSWWKEIMKALQDRGRRRAMVKVKEGLLIRWLLFFLTLSFSPRIYLDIPLHPLRQIPTTRRDAEHYRSHHHIIPGSCGSQP